MLVIIIVEADDAAVTRNTVFGQNASLVMPSF